MLKEYRFERHVNKVASKYNSIVDTKTYYKVNEHWVNAVVYSLLFDRAVSKGYKYVEDDSNYRVYENGKYYKAEEFEYYIILSKRKDLI